MRQDMKCQDRWIISNAWRQLFWLFQGLQCAADAYGSVTLPWLSVEKAREPLAETSVVPPGVNVMVPATSVIV